MSAQIEADLARAEEIRRIEEARHAAEQQAQQSFMPPRAESTDGWGSSFGAEPSWGDLVAPPSDWPFPDSQPDANAAPYASNAVAPPPDEARADESLWRIVRYDNAPHEEQSPFEVAFDSVDASLEAIVGLTGAEIIEVTPDDASIAFTEPQLAAEPPPASELEVSWPEPSETSFESSAAAAQPEPELEITEFDVSPSSPPSLDEDLLDEDILADPSDPSEAARLRRQRLLRRAMENIGAIPSDRPPARPEVSEGVAPARPAPAAASSAPPADAADLAAKIEAHHALIASGNKFTLLGLSARAGRNEVKAAFLGMAKIFHPDRLPESLAHLSPKITAVFEAVREAYEVLYDDVRRAEYAKSLEKPAKPAAAPPAPAASGSEPTDLVRRGEQLLKKRDFRGAEDLFAQAMDVAPSASTKAAVAWAIYLDPTRKGEIPRAKQLMVEALKMDSACDRAHYQLGVISRVEGDLDKAERHFRDAVHANPKHLEANQELRLIEMRRAKGKKGLFGR